MPAKWILLVLEDGIFSDESICYSIKLARRIGCAISVLMLSGNTDSASGERDDEQVMMQQTLDMIMAEGIQAQGSFGYGDKASEFLKHLALNSSLSTIIWGGSEEIVTGQKRKKADHWFSKVKSVIRCPVVRPTIKYKFEKDLKERR